MFAGFTEETFSYFTAIRFCNNREFFQANHDWYVRAVREPLLDLADALGDTVRAIDPELENTLRTIVNENDTIEEMLEDLEEKLGVTIDFESLRSGRKGDIAVALVFARNSRNVDGIIQQIFEALNPVLGTLRSSGEYQADMATVWADGGCYTVIRVTVEDSGRTPTYTPPINLPPPPV